MYVIAVLGKRKDFGFIRRLKSAVEKNGLNTECVFGKMSSNELGRIISLKKPDVVIAFSEGSFPVLKAAGLPADIFIPLKRNLRFTAPVKNGAFVILSLDDKKIFPFFLRKGLSLITCGFSSKASITISGVDKDEGKIQCCVQREIVNFKGWVFESQEFSVERDNERDEKTAVDRILIIVGVLLVMGILTVNGTSKI